MDAVEYICDAIHLAINSPERLSGNGDAVPVFRTRQDPGSLCPISDDALVEYVKNALAGAKIGRIGLPDAIHAPGQGVSDYGPITPSVLWQMQVTDRDSVLDGVLDAPSTFFEIECRSANPGEAHKMAKDILNRIENDGRLSHVLADYDEPDDRSQQRSEYFSHILEVGLSN